MKSEKPYEILDGLPSYRPIYIPISTDEEPCYSENSKIKYIIN